MRYALRIRLFNRARIIAVATIAVAILWLSPTGAAGPTRILVLGDSLTAGYGLPSGEGFTDRLEAHLAQKGFQVRVLNAGVSGDTSAGGLARLDWALTDKPAIAIVELGANDGLRGLAPKALRENLDKIVRRLRMAGIRVLLTGMRAPPNLGRAYEEDFNRVFPEIAKKHGVAFYPFFLDGVAADPALNQPDGIHPNRRGVGVIVDRITPYVVRLLKDLKQE